MLTKILDERCRMSTVGKAKQTHPIALEEGSTTSQCTIHE